MTEEQAFKVEALDHILTKVLDDIESIKFDMANEDNKAQKKEVSKPATNAEGGSNKAAPAAKKSVDPSQFEYAGKHYMMKRERIMGRIRDTHKKVSRKDLHDDPALLRVAMVNHPYYFTPLKSVESVEKEQKKTTTPKRKSTKKNTKK